MTVGEKLKELRNAKGWTLDVIQAKSGINRQLINDYEQGKREPGIHNLRVLVNALEVTLIEFQDCELNKKKGYKSREAKAEKALKVKYRPNEKQIARAMIFNEGHIKETAEYLKISQQLLQRMIKKSDKLQKVREQLLQLDVDQVQRRLFFEAKERGDFRAIKYILNTHGKALGYGLEKNGVTINNQINQQVDVPKLTDEVKKKLLNDFKQRLEEKRKLTEQSMDNQIREIGLKELPEKEKIIDAEIVPQDEHN